MRRLPSTDDWEDHDSRSAVVRRCAALADSTAFNLAIFCVILANAVVLGIETYDDSSSVLGTLDRVFLGVFVVELGIRLVAHGSNPLRFFRSGWNVFDFVVVLAAFTPGLRENATLLRLVRLARIVRIVRLLPDLRVLVTAVARSIPGVLSLAIMTLLLVYLYGMVGWVLYGDELAGYANAGEAMLSMFVLLSLENLPTYIEEGRAVSDWTIPFYVSYVLLASFLVFNFFIGVIVNSMERAREIEAERERSDALEHGREVVGSDGARAGAGAGAGAGAAAAAAPGAEERIAALRALLDELERDLRPPSPAAR